MKEYPTVTVTGKDIYKAMEDNGFEIIRGAWYDGFDNHACILGGTAINLKVVPFYADEDNDNNTLGEFMNSTYDEEVDDYAEIRTLEGELNKHIVPANHKWAYPENHKSPQGIATTIEAWNDKEYDGDRPDEYARQYSDESDYSSYNRALNDFYEANTGKDWNYHLQTWDEILEMGRELLELVWDTEFTITLWKNPAFV